MRSLALTLWCAHALFAQSMLPPSAIEGAIDTAKVLKLLYVNYDPKTGTSTGMDGALVGEYAVQQVSTDGKRQFILYTVANAPGNDCHGCGVILVAAMFEQQGPRWILEASNFQLSGIGNTGRPGECEPVQWGAGAFGLLVTDGWVGYGQITRWQTLYALDKGVFRAIFGVTLSDTNGFSLAPDSEKYSWSIEWKFGPPAGNGIFDIVVTADSRNSFPRLARDLKGIFAAGVYRYDGATYRHLQKRVPIGFR